VKIGYEVRFCLKQTFIYYPYPDSEKLDVLLRNYKDGNNDLEFKNLLVYGLQKVCLGLLETVLGYIKGKDNILKRIISICYQKILEWFYRYVQIIRRY